jgi:hypothetical protein
MDESIFMIQRPTIIRIHTVAQSQDFFSLLIIAFFLGMPAIPYLMNHKRRVRPIPCRVSSVLCTQIRPVMLQLSIHRLSLSKLNLSMLLCRFTTPNLKNRSSPAAVRPPMYHFSWPITSRNPSDELSEPRRILSDVEYPADVDGPPWPGE